MRAWCSPEYLLGCAKTAYETGTDGALIAKYAETSICNTDRGRYVSKFARAGRQPFSERPLAERRWAHC
jgi:hypothetical protein